jgi:hypothetical protein
LVGVAAKERADLKQNGSQRKRDGCSGGGSTGGVVVVVPVENEKDSERNGSQAYRIKDE